MKKQKNKNFYLRVESLSSRVTGSCNYCTLNLPDKPKVEFIIDCGSFLEDDTMEFNKDFPFNPSKLSFAIATHYHGDHTGRFAMLYNKGYQGYVYGSSYTVEYMKKKAISAYYEHKRALKEKTTLWEEKDSISFINNLQELKINEPVQIHPNIEIVFFPNAHCRGAIMCRVKCTWEDEVIYVLFTGDYKEQNVIRKSWIPPEYKEEGPMNIVTEATYGLQEKPEKCFDKLVVKAIERNGSVLIIALGENMFEHSIMRIKQLKKKGIIDKNIPIYIEMNRVFEISKKILNSMPSNVTFVKDMVEKTIAKYDKEQKIIILTERGGIQVFLPYMIQNEKNVLIFTNHLPVQSNLRKILEISKGDSFVYMGQKITKVAQVYNTEEFGCHAFVEEIERLIKSFKKVNAIFFGHGDKYAKRAAAGYAGGNLEINSFILKRGRAFRITPTSVKYE